MSNQVLERHLGNALILGNFIFPNGNAAGRRVLGLGLLLQRIGYVPVFIGFEKGTLKAPWKAIKYTYEASGIDYYTLPYPEKKIDWLDYNAQYQRTLKVINKIGTNNIKLIIVYGSMALSFWMKRIILFARRNGIKVIADCVDWIDFSDGSFFANLVKYLDTNYQKRLLIPKADGVIAISRYLQNYYLRRGCNVVVIPPVSDFIVPQEDGCKNGDLTTLSLAYAGVPFRVGTKSKVKQPKDRLDKTIELLHSLYREGYKFVFNIYGVDAKDFLTAFPRLSQHLGELKNSIVFWGNVSGEVARHEIAKADFTILQRDRTKITRAGFPTKVVESICLGTPVILNRTSNVDEYLNDGLNCFFLTGDMDVSRMRQILSMNRKDLIRMKNRCLTSNPFALSKYENILRNFLETILEI